MKPILLLGPARSGGGPVERWCIDLREVTFFDSTGLQLVLDADVRAREEGRILIVAPGDGEPRRILELAEVADRLLLEE